MISLRNLSHTVQKNGSEVVVLDDVSVDLPTDRPFGVLGLENSGKTTLMRLLSGFARPQSGEITRYARLSFPIGYEGVFKRNLSPRENITRFSEAFGAQVHDVSRFVASATGIGAAAFNEALGKLPEEMQLRFVFVATYALPFDCYLVDERYTPNEPGFKPVCQRLLEERAQSSGLLFATRRARLAQRLCSAAAVLDRGKLILYDRVEDALDAFSEIEARADAERMTPAAITQPARAAFHRGDVDARRAQAGAAAPSPLKNKPRRAAKGGAV